MRETDIPVQETYVEALIDAAGGKANKQALCAEAQELLRLLHANKPLVRFLERPAILKEEKKHVIASAFKGRLSPLMLNLPLLLIDKHRAELWEEILAHFVRKIEEEEGIRAATVTTAREISTEQKVKLQTVLEKYTQSKLRIQYRIKSDLIGGIVFHSGDRMIDSSVQTGLHSLRAKLLRAQLERGATT